VVPDFEGYPLRVAFERAGDEAAAHRAALGSSAVVASDRDRHRAAACTGAGYGARLWILDDGWEQRTLRWNELWVAVDPRLPVGNGARLPAGPLRRPPATLRAAAVIAFVLDEADEGVPAETEGPGGRPRPFGHEAPVPSRPEGTSRLGDRTVEAWRAGPRVALVSGVGAPERLTRFVRSSGIDLVSHAAFPDHARWSVPDLSRAVERAAGMGAEVVLITEKDEPRWPEAFFSRLSVRVLRSTLRPLDPVDRALEGMMAAARAGNADPVEGALRR
jgi:tetraacyldisaccharide 4'-kinase